MKSIHTLCAIISCSCLCGVACGPEERTEHPETKTVMTRQDFGNLEGGSVDLYSLTHAGGGEVRITNYGGIVVSLRVPDRNGHLAEVVLGFDRLEAYLGDHPYFGALIGRYANRIGGAEFTLDRVGYRLAANNGENHLHGGVKGFDKVVWDAEPITTEDGDALLLKYVSTDGEEGYPGNLSVEVTYRWTPDDALRIDYRATTDERTIVNLSHHSYFNLLDAGKSDILGHEMMIRANRFTPVDKALIPTGELRSVEGTPLDFTDPMAIGARIDADDEQLGFGGGYDHNWVLNDWDGTLKLAARVYEPTTGRVMEVHTTEPGLQFYSGNFLDGSQVGKNGTAYQHRSGFCLEAQHFPDSPNKPEFPSTVLEPGAVYEQTTIYKFSTR